MKKIFIGLLIVLGIASAYLIFVERASKEIQTKDETDALNKNEERPKQETPADEIRVNQRHLERYYASKTSLKNASVYSSYANGKIEGTWEQVRFLSSGKTGYGYRVDGSIYDQYNDVLYAVSYAGHIWKINRQSDDFTKTQWERINHKDNFLTSYIEGLNKSDGSFRIIRSSDNGMQYSDNEGRDWTTALGVQAIEKSDEGIIAKNAGSNRVFALLKTSSTNLQVYFSLNNGESYTALSTSFNPAGYKVKMFKALNSESVFIAAYSMQNSKISIYECKPEDSDFSLVNTSSKTFVGIDRVFGTYYNNNYHFYIAAKNTHIYYSADKGAAWQLKNNTNNSSGDTNPRTVHATKPNVIFQGYLDVNMSVNYGESFTNFSHLLGWDVHHMKMYQKKDGSYFHFVGKDFGCYIADQPEYSSSYVQLNNTAPIQMCYDADHSQNYYSSFTSTQDRGTMSYVSSTNESLTNDVKTTDGLRVTLGNNEESVWTWMYYGSIFHQSNFAARNSGLSGINWTGNWWAAPMIPSPNVKEDAVYIAAGNRLKKFTFNPEQETIIETDHYFDFLQKTGFQVTGFGYSMLNRNRWYASVQNGNFLYSVNGGQTFEQTSYSGSLPRANDQTYNYAKNQHVIKASDIIEQKVYYAGVGNLFMISDDGGKTFTNHSAGLDVYRIRDFDFSPDEKYIFAACAYAGIWVYSVDEDRWFEMNDEPLPVVDFTDVEYIKKENTVNFASFGNGILRFKLDAQNQALQYPDSLTAEITNAKLVKLNWNDKSENEDGFIIERSANGVFYPLKNLTSNQNSFSDSSVVNPGIYSYRIKAFNSTDESYYSNYAVVEVKPAGEVSKKSWQLASVDSEEINGYGAAKAFDDDANTMWHTQWSINPIPNHPHNLVIDMNDTLDLYGFSYLPRQDNNWNGVIKDYEFYVAMDKVNWTKMSSGSWQKTMAKKEEYFTTTVEARYIKLVSLSEVNGSAFTSCAELSVVTQLPVSVAPKAPQFVQGGRLSDSEIELIWLDLSDNEQGFKIEQLIDGSFTTIYTSGVNATTYKLQNTNTNSAYTFRIRAFNDVGISGYSDTLTIYVPGTVVSVEDKIWNESNVVVYPNPFENELKFKLDDSGSYSDWQILNISGRVILNGIISDYSKGKTINVQELKSGIYVIRFKGKNGWVSKTVVKK